MKLSTTLILTVLTTTQLLAIEKGDYIGVDIGSTRIDTNVEGVSGSGSSLTLKIGHQYETNGRFGAFVHKVKATDANFLIGGISFDYLIGEADLKPFVGGIIGYGSYSVDNLSEDIAGAVYGFQLGLNYTINTKVSLDAGYRVLKANMKSSAGSLEIDDITNWSVGINYNF